jgi:O-antigen/teichoic acid export membrane protein
VSVKTLLSTYSPQFLRLLLARMEDSPIGYRLAKGVFWSMAGATVSRGLMLGATILVARLLGTKGYGEFGMVQSTVGTFGVLAGFGMGITATKHVAELRESYPARAGQILGFAGLFAAVTGGLMALTLFCLAPALAVHMLNAPHLSSVLRIGALLLFFNALNGAQTGGLAGFEAFNTIAYVNLASGLFSFPILVCGAWLGGLTGAVWAVGVNLMINWMLNHLALRREAHRYGVPLTFTGIRLELPILWTFSLPSAISAVMVGPVIWLCKTMLAHEPAGYAGLGIFIAAESWRTALFFACQMVAQANFPILAQLYGQGDRRLFKKQLLAQMVLNGAIVSLGTLVVGILSRPIMSSYGPAFSQSASVLIIVMLASIPMQMGSVAGAVNKCAGNIWWGVLLNTMWAAVYLATSASLVKHGAMGLAWATLIAYSAHCLFTLVYVIWIFRTSPKLRGGPAF